MYRVNILAGTAWPCSWLKPMSETFGVAVSAARRKSRFFILKRRPSK